MEETDVRKILKTAHDYAYLHDSWVNPLADALEGVTLAMASRKPNSQSNSIWAIVLHMAVWNENMVQRVRTGEKTRPAEGAWPPLPQTRTEAEWEQAKQRLFNSIEALGQMIDHEPLENVIASPYGIPDLVCRSVHMAYHIGQITTLRGVFG